MKASTARPRVICHMSTSIDGRIVVDGWPHAIAETVHRAYEQGHRSYAPNAWLCGRVTMERFAGAVRSDEEVARTYVGDGPREDFVAPGDHASYAFAVDTHGRLAWESNDIDGDHVVAILSERVSDEYLAFLRERGVSYLLCGHASIDFAAALQKIGARFDVRVLMLEGGGAINGAMLRAGLVDEVSLLMAPVADGRVGTAALFDVEGGEATPRGLALVSVGRLAGDLVWLRYAAPEGQTERGPT